MFLSKFVQDMFAVDYVQYALKKEAYIQTINVFTQALQSV